MSSIRLNQDYGGDKAGRIISVPFGVGTTLIARGIGEYPEPPAAAVPAPTAADQAAQVERIKREAVAEFRRLEAEHAAEVKHLEAAIAAANDQVAKANADLAKVTAERDELKAAAAKTKEKDKPK